jgi:ectoine hydroxylase-related dioxygenase (phytanoyl-CoA dioxygenase family)
MFYTHGMKNPESIKQEYDRNGCIKFEGVISREEAIQLGVELQSLIEDRDNDAQWKGDFINDEERGKSKILDIHDVHHESESFKKLRRDARIMGKLAILLGGPVVNHHDKGFVKPGVKGDTYGGKFPQHQDYHFFPHSDDMMLAAIIYLSDITEDMGPVKVFPGSHLRGPLPFKKVEGGEPYLDGELPLEQAVTMTGKAGDMVAFNINTVHMSGPNKSLRDRLSWLIQVRHRDTEPLYSWREPDEGDLLWPPVRTV